MSRAKPLLYLTALFGAVSVSVAYEVQPTRLDTVTVGNKGRAWQENGALYDRVSTDKGAFAVYRIPVREGFRPNSRFSELRVSCTYNIRSYGFNAGPVLARHILSAEHVPTSACPVAAPVRATG